MTSRSQNRWRSFFTSFCLLAVVLLYAPLALASWSSYKAACCISDQCPIHGHHHRNIPAAPANHMDCGHDMSSMTACTMSCCQDSTRPAVTSAIFVLPLPARLVAPSARPSSIVLSSLPDLLRSIEPLSPPPRITALAA